MEKLSACLMPSGADAFKLTDLQSCYISVIQRLYLLLPHITDSANNLISNYKHVSWSCIWLSTGSKHL